MYRSLTADRIIIHPGSVMFKMDPQYIVAGEIIKTTRMYAMSVSPLSKGMLETIQGDLLADLTGRAVQSARREGVRDVKLKRAQDFTNAVKLGDEVFEIKTIKNKKLAILPWERLVRVKEGLSAGTGGNARYKGQWPKLRGVITLKDTYKLLEGERLEFILSLAPSLNLEGVLEKQWSRRNRFNSQEDLGDLLGCLPLAVTPGLWKSGKKDLGFLCLLTDGAGAYWFTCSRGFHTSLNESLASVETLIDELGDTVDPELKHIVNQTYRRLSDYLI
jgi:hypothetical protein